MKVSQLLAPVKKEVEKPFEEKLERARQLVRFFCNFFPKNCAVSCSFGKDSTVVLALVREVMPEVPVIFNNTGVQYGETYRFKSHLVEEWNLNLIETKPIKSFWEVADKYGLPDGKKKSDRCCDYLKEIPYRKVVKKYGFAVSFTGITVLESRHRMFHICESGQAYYSRKDNVMKVHPIAFWTPQEVWDFINRVRIPVNPAYEKYGIERLGCVPCTSHKMWREQMAKVNPKLYAHIQRHYFGQEVFAGSNPVRSELKPTQE